MADLPEYDEWVASRRQIEPSSELTDRVMVEVRKRQVQPTHELRFADRINESRLARSAACLAAVLVSSLPFLFVADVAYLLVF